jgi:hypothetical protein
MTTTQPSEHLPTEHDALRAALVELTPAQALAVDALATGATHDEAGKVADVARETVTRWANYHAGFRAALDGYRHTLAIEQLDAACRLRGKALAVIEGALDLHDVDAALAVLRAVPAFDVTPPLDAAGRLADDVRRLAATPPLASPAPRGPSGRIDRDLDGTDAYIHDLDREWAEHHQQIATERLAAAAGVAPDDVPAP